MFDTFKNWVTDNKKEIEAENIDGIFYPTEKSIVYLHDYIIRQLKLDEEEVHDGIISTGVLSFPGVKEYLEKSGSQREDLLLRGAYIFNKFLQEGHPFVDGNKRTGFVTLWLFLLLNKIKLKPSSWDYKSHTEKIIQWAKNIEKDNIQEIADWLDENCE